MPDQASPSHAAAGARLLALTEQCVRCGLCLPHCPTYQLALDEGESPRGRIALIAAVTSGALPTEGAPKRHLDHCLGCRACETACPSLVPFGDLLDAARARQLASLPRWRRWARRARLGALSNARFMRFIARAAAGYRGSGVARMAEWLGLHQSQGWGPFHRLALVLGRPQRLPRSAPVAPTLQLFAGCMSEVAQPQALHAARRILQALGERVAHDPAPACCGAILRHNGLPDRADQTLARQATVLDGHVIVGTASACVAELHRQPELAQSAEICTWLAGRRWPDDLALASLPDTVAVHEPCTHRHGLGGNHDVYHLLERIPDLRLLELPENATCCGAAGTHLIEQPVLSQALLQRKIMHLRRLAPAVVVTTNPGCALHLRAGVREAGLDIEVCHPIELIDRQLRQPQLPTTRTGHRRRR
ncbi:Fe-S oxidoreductase [Thioflavicoccus mobilis 8321]|uniref:Glycolate oxidase iron-sulfur subunit n=1 Tax=Thioflavicoccus mobilis 8321 TaxID=765912 RepID=L0GVZ0_9GAMM|nr:(Fe-S)-binding protein [Thioflavicoccus mobilis]AGA89982.1 Fe-S oxidoreductase [Thioflavicoccus mobilis 8321]